MFDSELHEVAKYIRSQIGSNLNVIASIYKRVSETFGTGGDTFIASDIREEMFDVLCQSFERINGIGQDFLLDVSGNQYTCEYKFQKELLFNKNGNRVGSKTGHTDKIILKNARGDNGVVMNENTTSDFYIFADVNAMVIGRKDDLIPDEGKADVKASFPWCKVEWIYHPNDVSVGTIDINPKEEYEHFIRKVISDMKESYQPSTNLLSFFN